MNPAFDRSAENLGSIVRFGHVNVNVPNPFMAQTFYVCALGLTRDPYAQTGIDNMWINVGQSQFHLPTGDATRLRGHTGIVMPDRAGLLKRLEQYAGQFAGTQFDFKAEGDHVAIRCPWGNRFRVYEPSPRFAPIWLGIAYLEFEVPHGVAAGIARFYERMLFAQATLADEGGARVAVVQAGQGQQMRFRESAGEVPAYDGHHIQVYVSRFGETHALLEKAGLISQENTRFLYRFVKITDPDDGRLLYEIEHEVRSMTHPLFLRPQVNRNPAVGQREYQLGIPDDQWNGPPLLQPK